MYLTTFDEGAFVLFVSCRGSAAERLIVWSDPQVFLDCPLFDSFCCQHDTVQYMDIYPFIHYWSYVLDSFTFQETNRQIVPASFFSACISKLHGVSKHDYHRGALGPLSRVYMLPRLFSQVTLCSFIKLGQELYLCANI